jgi:DNA-directed RNA polymerase subunit beta'
MYGARRGLVRKVQEVQEPGVLSKMMQNTAMDQVIADEDCGTSRGISMPVTDGEVHDRHLAADVKVGQMHVPAGTMLTPDVVGQIRSANKDTRIVVRSPLKCQHEQGMCQKCMGLNSDGKHYEVGTNVGVIATHSLGERSTQLMLRSFHTGGAVGAANVSDKFKQVDNLLKLPEKIEDQASLAHTTGTVEKIDRDKTGARIWINGKSHFVGKDRYGTPLHEQPVRADETPGYRSWQVPKVGAKIKAGQLLSDPNRTIVNPKDLHKATNNIDSVQNFMAGQLDSMFAGEGVKRRHSEVMVRSMTSTTKVVNPGDHPDILRGEYHNSAKIRNINSELAKQGKKPVLHTPEMRGIDTLPLVMREDWMAKLQHRRLRDTIVEASATGAKSSIHGTHPVPGMIYGAEFGYTKRHALRPGFERLKDVPEYSY